jgi:5-methyltetrahydropteroyltriglutamate--homocysteine methyltransferase
VSGATSQRGCWAVVRYEAAKYTGLERLGVSTQCGFSSTLPGANLTTEDTEEQKLELVAEVAHTVW